MNADPRYQLSDDQPNDDFQTWIDGLLRSPSAEASTPVILSQRIETSIRQRRRRSLVWKSTAALTAAASIALFAVLQHNPALVNVDRKVVSLPTTTTTTNSESASDALPPRATFVARSDLLAIPIESDDPQVTIIQVYQTTHTQRRRQREATLQAINNHLQQLQQYPINGG